MNFSRRSYQQELLDGHGIPFADIERNMLELNTINTWLGGHAITRKGFARIAGGRKNIVVAEIGCGGGDNLAAIVKWCRKKKIAVRTIGIDLKKECIEVAERNPAFEAGAEWIASDYRDVFFQNRPDIIYSSLFCHHFTDEELVNQLQWMRKHSALGFFINDLHRHRLAWFSIRALTQLFSSSYLVKHDAPLSVARGFIKADWRELLNRAGVHAQISWEWAFRHLILSKHA